MKKLSRKQISIFNKNASKNQFQNPFSKNTEGVLTSVIRKGLFCGLNFLEECIR